MTKEEIDQFIKELEELENEALEELDRLAESSEDSEYQRGYADGVSDCLELLRGRSGYYD